MLTKKTLARLVFYPVFMGVLFYYFGHPANSAFPNNGFDLGNTLIPRDEIRHGGPPRDGIPAIDKPRFLSVDQVDFLQDHDRVLGVSRKGIAKAYPVKILNHHEIVNDFFGDEAVVVTYCPLCGTGVSYLSKVGGIESSFGVSGLLYNSDVLLYDRETESLWSQILSRAVSGKLMGQKLIRVPLSHTTWVDWKTLHPDTKVLSTETGYSRDYSRNPYGGYQFSKSIYFPVSNKDARYHPKEMVIGLEVNGSFRAYPFIELLRVSADINERFAGEDVRVHFDAINRTGAVYDSKGDEIPTIISYWFAWIAFHPDTEVFKVEK